MENLDRPMIRAVRRDFVGYDGQEIVQLFALRGSSKKREHATGLDWKVTSRNATISAFMEIDKGVAQRLMDDFWSCGLRPSEGTGSAGAYKAQGDHLKDMQKIAFKMLKINE